MKAYRIVDWWKFELLKNGRLAAANTKMVSLRIKPLLYVRFPVHGHTLSADYRRMVKRAGSEMAAACDGVYKMLVGLAGNQVREYRGWVLDDRQRPLDSGQVAELLCLSEKKTNQIFEILRDREVNWIELLEFPESLHKSLDGKIPDFSQNIYSGNNQEKKGSPLNGDEIENKSENSGVFSDLPGPLHKSLDSSDLADGSQNIYFGKNQEKKGSPLYETETEDISKDFVYETEDRDISANEEEGEGE